MLDCLVVNRGRDCSVECKCFVACPTCYNFVGLCGCSSVPSEEVVVEETPKTVELEPVVEQHSPPSCNDRD